MPQLYIVAEREVAGFESELKTNGRGLSEESERLDRIAEEIRVRPLMAFFSMGLEETSTFIEGNDGELPDALSEEAWFDPKEGLGTVRALSGWLAEHSNALVNTTGLIEELRELDAILARLAREGIRWHLAIDF